MKKILLCFLALAVVMVFYSCQKANDGKCHISGIVNGEQYEGKRIFLVPFSGPATAETVDSMEITNGKFHFEPDSMQMYKILLDYHYRMGLQPLLIVGEPGNITVTIDSVSHAVGTPQNDSLEQWKVQTEIHNRQMGLMRMRGERTDSFHLVYKNYTRQLAKNMEGTTLGDFLKALFPLTYKRKFPDGRIVTMNADTNEEIPE
ncbi:MAG: DUF4369 domain-containing protein [Prevotella sp.]|nr:DUF4369 domain-containing protein [Prevotella sp.]